MKALVRYNVDGDPATNAASVAALTELRRPAPRRRAASSCSRSSCRRPRPSAPPPAAPRASSAPREPALIARAITALLAAGLDPGLWKVEGIDDPDDAATVAAAAAAGGRAAGLVVLGAGAPAARVDAWLRVAAATPGYVGFAVGRSLWWDEIRDLLAGRRDRDAHRARDRGELPPRGATSSPPAEHGPGLSPSSSPSDSWIRRVNAPS